MLAALAAANPYRAFRAVKDYAGKAMSSRFARDVVTAVRDFPVDGILADALPGILIGAQATRRPTAAPCRADVCAAYARAATAGEWMVTRT